MAPRLPYERWVTPTGVQPAISGSTQKWKRSDEARDFTSKGVSAVVAPATQNQSS